jgi:serine/threonine protein kinase
MDRYVKIKKLGEGGFGKVYLMKDLEKSVDNNQVHYAVKVIDISANMSKADGIFEIDRESKTLRMLDSRYIVRLEHYFVLEAKA